ncbi:complement factor H-related protein 5-like isoform X1 [Micropterus salmoides]|uniref:complement factor H-related protein 5-like isoform X1 n=1 Tax=Micropterus salmoides TaxID=27706 RepID=UPI0018EBB348|nr:complement factor H-related protein 5-like isoform X1 [Micropterus salmoides]
MNMRYLGLVLLIWFPGVLHAQSAAQSCSAPKLDGGFFAPKQETYSHGTKLSYTCDTGRKPVVKGWWATSTCQTGKWSHTPQCIDEAACLPPEMPNAKHTENQNGWYEDGHIIRITCDKGYEPKGQDVTAICINGAWSSVPVCEKSILACGEPPKIPHAVIIHQRYQEMFAVDSEVQYECEDGYTVEGAEKSIFCIAGTWTKGPPCSRVTRPETGHGGSTVGGAGWGGTTSAERGTQPAEEGACLPPEIPNAKYTENQNGWYEDGSRLRVTCVQGYEPKGHQVTICRSGTWSSVPVCERSSATSGSNDRDSQPAFMPIDHCGEHPNVPNSDVVQVNQMSLKYQCNAFYTRVGSDTVTCYSDGSWSDLPICKEAFCVVDHTRHRWDNFQLSGVEYIKEGEKKTFPCTSSNWSRVFQCIEGRIHYTSCCHYYVIQWGDCQ